MYQGVELRMLHTAISKRWLTDDLRQKAVETIRLGLESDDERIRMRATQCVIAMEAQNQKDDHSGSGKRPLSLEEHQERILKIAADLGIDPQDIIDSANERESEMEVKRLGAS